jgi:hypothetical protein
MPLVNACRLWIPEMDQIIEIYALFGIHFCHRCFDIASLDVSQTSQCGHSKRTVTCLRSNNPQSSLHGNVGEFQEVDVTWQLLRLSCSSELVWNLSKMKPFEPELLMMNSATCPFEILRCLHNILHERKGHSRMSSAIACVKSELTDLLDRGSFVSSILPCRKGVRFFYGRNLESLIVVHTC